MNLALWKREIRRARRRRWLLPWMPVPALVVVVTLVLRVLLGADHYHARPPFRYLFWLVSGPNHVVLIRTLLTVGPTVVLCLWILWVVSESVVRDQEARSLAELALTRVSTRSLALTKAFAPSLIGIYGWVALAAFDAWFLTWSMVRGMDPVLRRMGHETMVFWGHLSLPAIQPSEIGPLWRFLLAIEMPARAFLTALALSALAVWTGSRCRSAVKAFLVCMAISAAALGGVLVLEGTLLRVMRPYDLPSPNPAMLTPAQYQSAVGQWIEELDSRRQELTRLRSHLACREAVQLFALHFVVPLIWLGWWWRWAGHGFARVYFRDG